MALRKRTNLIVIHCSATRAKQDIDVAEIRKWHLAQGWRDCGYHYVIKRDGIVQNGRPPEEVGSHVKGHNSTSVGVCLVGGLADDGKHGENNFTQAQFMSLTGLVAALLKRYPGSQVVGHRDLSPDMNGDGKITSVDWVKECPSFSVADWLKQ